MSKVVYPAHRYVRAAAEVELPDGVGGEEIAETLYRVDEDVAGNGIDTKAVVQLYRIVVKVEKVCQDFVSHISFPGFGIKYSTVHHGPGSIVDGVAAGSHAAAVDSIRTGTEQVLGNGGGRRINLVQGNLPSFSIHCGGAYCPETSVIRRSYTEEIINHVRGGPEGVLCY